MLTPTRSLSTAGYSLGSSLTADWAEIATSPTDRKATHNFCQRLIANKEDLIKLTEAADILNQAINYCCENGWYDLALKTTFCFKRNSEIEFLKLAHVDVVQVLDLKLNRLKKEQGQEHTAQVERIAGIVLAHHDKIASSLHGQGFVEHVLRMSIEAGCFHAAKRIVEKNPERKAISDLFEQGLEKHLDLLTAAVQSGTETNRDLIHQAFFAASSPEARAKAINLQLACIKFNRLGLGLSLQSKERPLEAVVEKEILNSAKNGIEALEKKVQAAVASKGFLKNLWNRLKGEEDQTPLATKIVWLACCEGHENSALYCDIIARDPEGTVVKKALSLLTKLGKPDIVQTLCKYYYLPDFQ